MIVAPAQTNYILEQYKTSLDELISFIKGYNIKPLFLCITGSHMWNLENASSDLDIRGVYRKPTDIILSIHKGTDSIDGLNVLNKNIDIQFYEVEKAFNMLHTINGNVIEMLLAPTTIYDSGDVPWTELAKKRLSRKLVAYYKGYYNSQRKRCSTNRGGKALVYTYREIYAGIMLMRHGKIIYNFNELVERFAQEFMPSKLLTEFMKNRDVQVTDTKLKAFEAEWDMLCAIIEKEAGCSKLPDKYQDYNELNDLLLKLRYAKH